MRRTIIGTILSSSLLLTAAAYASPPASDSAASTHRVSTGVTPPRLLDSIYIQAPNDATDLSIPSGTQISVSFVVDAKGQPRDIHVVQGYTTVWNARAIDAVSKLHYLPASLDDQAVPMEMNLVITLN